MIAEKRAALVNDLSTGSGGAATPVAAPVLAAWPSKVPNAPVVFVVPPQAAAYVTGGPAFTQFTVALDVVVLAGRPDAADALTQLDELIEQVLLNVMDWTLTGADSPAVVTVGGVDFLATVIHLSQPGII